MERIIHKLDDIVTRLAKVESGFDTTRALMDRFYERDFAPLIAIISENQKRIVRMEIEIAKLKTKIAIWGSLGVIIGSTIISIAINKITE